MPDTPKPERKMPKGGRKGGTVFPRIALAEALRYAKKLVSKTHTGPQSTETIYAGVVNAKGGRGAIRVSALRQFLLIEGTGKTGLRATELAKKISAAPDEESAALLQRACLGPKVFAQIFEAFHGDTVSRAKIRQRAAALDVHPEDVDNCATSFIESVEVAKLAKVLGDQVSLKSKVMVSEATAVQSQDSEDVDDPDQSSTDDSTDGASGEAPDTNESQHGERSVQKPSTRPNVTVAITVDSTMDPEKLAKQLELLKKFGAL